MEALDAKVVLRVVATALTALGVVWLAFWYFIPAPPSTIVIAAGFKDGSLDLIARRYRERLAQRNVKLDIRYVAEGGSQASLKLVEDQSSSVDAALLFSGITDSSKSPDLMSLGRVAVNPLWFFYNGTESLDRVAQLKGKRLGANLDFLPTQRILDASGVNANTARFSGGLGPSLVKALKDSEVDVIILLAQLDVPFIQSLMHDPTVRLMNMTQAEAFARILPYLIHLVLPQGVIDPENNIPAIDVNLMATTTAVVVRKTLHPELVYLLAQILKEEHSGAGVFHRAGELPTLTDPEFPMAEEAIDFYKNGPSFLHRYLPFWMISYAKRVAAIFVTVIAIVIPIFSFTPRFYAWVLQNYAEKLYRRLRTIEAGLKTDLTLSQIKVLEADLEAIDQAAHILPMRRSSLFFDLIMHIDITRKRLDSRLVILREKAA